MFFFFFSFFFYWLNNYVFSEPYTQYNIQVAAITGGGRGNFSDVYPALTDVSGKIFFFLCQIIKLGKYLCCHLLPLLWTFCCCWGWLMHHYIVYWKYLMGGITQLSTMAKHRSLMIMTQNFTLITTNLKHTTDIIHYHLYNADEFSVL